jgi:hypothetical protein
MRSAGKVWRKKCGGEQESREAGKLGGMGAWEPGVKKVLKLQPSIQLIVFIEKVIMMHRTCFAFILVIMLSPNLSAQEITQTIKGTVFDNETNTPLVGATVVIKESNPLKGSTTDLDGKFRLENVPVGRYSLLISYLGYETVTVPEILVTSSKEVIINTGLQQSGIKMNGVTISGNTEKSKPLNTMASISARSFTVEETRRYAGGLDDPARLASSFAGVAMSSINDNGIVIRGNSAKGVAWRLEGVDIPNPNHFAGANVAGGGIVTVFSSQMLANSDFYTGAFPAEYGNAMAGVFDMKLRIGNSEKWEHAVQLGLLGLDISSEGPFKKGSNSSYLFNYRYSTFGMIKTFLPDNMGIPDYQDLCFKLNFPVKHGVLSLWGIGSTDNYPKPAIDDSSKWETADDRTYFDWHLKMGAAGVNYKLFLGRQTYLSTTLSGSGTINNMDEKRFDDSLVARQNWLFTDNSSKIILSSFLNHKFNEQLTLRTGFFFHTLFYKLDLNSTVNDIPSTYQNFVKEDGTSYYLEYYAQVKYDIKNNLTLFAGLNTMYFFLNQDFSADPRISIKWQLNPAQSLSFGFGKHSQLEELKIYFINNDTNGKIEYPNKNLGLSHSLQFVLGYDWQINENLRLRIEPYYQYLYNIPGIKDSSYSMINFTQDWTFREALINNSKGRNYGIDITFERFLHNNYYYLITASLFDSRYKGGDGVWRNTLYNKGYIVNLLIGKEFYFKKNRIFGANLKLNFMGGERISPVLTNESLQAERVIYDETRAFQDQMPATYNLDITVTYRTNKRKHSSIWALQIKNALGSPMYEGYDYYYKTASIKSAQVVIILPVLSYKIEF